MRYRDATESGPTKGIHAPPTTACHRLATERGRGRHGRVRHHGALARDRPRSARDRLGSARGPSGVQGEGQQRGGESVQGATAMPPYMPSSSGPMRATAAAICVVWLGRRARLLPRALPHSTGIRFSSSFPLHARLLFWYKVVKNQSSSYEYPSPCAG